MDCQEYYQNSVLFSQFLLTLCYTNNLIPYLLFFLTISDHQQEQETRILVSSTATNTFTPPCCHCIPDQYPSHHPKRLPETPPYPYQLVPPTFDRPLLRSEPTRPPSDTNQTHWQSLRPGATKGTRANEEAILAAPLGSCPSESPSRMTSSSPP